MTFLSVVKIYRNLYQITWCLVAEDGHVYVQEALEQLLGPELAFGVSRQIIRGEKNKRLDGQAAYGNVAGLISIQRQVRQLISVTVL